MTLELTWIVITARECHEHGTIIRKEDGTVKEVRLFFIHHPHGDNSLSIFIEHVSCGVGEVRLKLFLEKELPGRG